MPQNTDKRNGSGLCFGNYFCKNCFSDVYELPIYSCRALSYFDKKFKPDC